MKIMSKPHQLSPCERNGWEVANLIKNKHIPQTLNSAKIFIYNAVGHIL